MKKLNSIFVVEDDLTARTMMLDFLSQYKDVAVKGFITGEACIGDILFHKKFPDLILMDYYLEGSIVAKYQGLETLAKIKELCKDTPIIMFTSVDKEDIREIAKEKGASDYIIKGPKGFEQLKRIIESNYELG